MKKRVDKPILLCYTIARTAEVTTKYARVAELADAHV